MTIKFESKQCRNTLQLLPWVANGTLDGADECSVREHLIDCPSCAEELASLSAMVQVFGEHIPSLDLSLWFHGLSTELDPQVIADHVAWCADCRGELLLDQDLAADQDLVPVVRVADRGDHARIPWSRLAAAALVLFAAGGLWVGQHRLSTEKPQRAEHSMALRQASMQTSTIVFADGFEGGSIEAWNQRDIVSETADGSLAVPPGEKQ